MSAEVSRGLQRPAEVGAGGRLEASTKLVQEVLVLGEPSTRPPQGSTRAPTSSGPRPGPPHPMITTRTITSYTNRPPSRPLLPPPRAPLSLAYPSLALAPSLLREFTWDKIKFICWWTSGNSELDLWSHAPLGSAPPHPASPRLAQVTSHRRKRAPLQVPI